MMKNLFLRGSRRTPPSFGGLLAVGQKVPAHAAAHHEGASNRVSHPNFHQGKARAAAWKNLNAYRPLTSATHSRRSRLRTSARPTKELGRVFVHLDGL